MAYTEKLTRDEAVMVTRDLMVAWLRSKGQFEGTEGVAARYLKMMSELRQGTLIVGVGEPRDGF